MKEIAYDPALRASATIVEVPHKQRGSYLTVGSPIKFSDFAPTITGSPLLGEHTDEVLTSLGYSSDQIAKLREASVLLKGASDVAETHEDSREPALAGSGSKK
jgi:formyl-CoA transferase